MQTQKLDAKQIAANQLNIDSQRIVHVAKTWKNWVIELESWGSDDDLVVVIPHDKFYDLHSQADAISDYAV
jgi:hypothetical protein